MIVRGKRRDTNEWVEGYFYKIIAVGVDGANGVSIPFIMEKNGNTVEVIEDTVGRLWFIKEDTTPIFEHDILRFENKEEKLTYMARYNKTFKCLALYCIDHSLQQPEKRWTFLNELLSVDEFFKYIRVVGNKWDNPELLGGGV